MRRDERPGPNRMGVQIRRRRGLISGWEDSPQGLTAMIWSSSIRAAGLIFAAVTWRLPSPEITRHRR